jgi:DNA-directed RNA polymerase subunit RPC12/RpoP
MMSNEGEIQVLALRCPSCGGALRVSAGDDHTQCEHCGSTVLIVNRETGETRIEETQPISPEDAAAARRVVKIVLWGTAISFALPIAITAFVSVVIAVVLLVLGFVLFGLGH